MIASPGFYRRRRSPEHRAGPCPDDSGEVNDAQFQSALLGFCDSARREAVGTRATRSILPAAT